MYVASADQAELYAVWQVVRAAFGDHDAPATLLGVAVLGYTGQVVEIEAVAVASGAAAGGTVAYAGWYFAYGNIVDIQHGDGVVTRYAHMSAFAPGIVPGAPVSVGQTIGKVGATGRAHGAHVHFEVRLNGHAVDPMPYLGLAACVGTPPSEPIETAVADDKGRPAR